MVDEMYSIVSRRGSTVSTTTQVSQQPPPVYPQSMLDDVQNTSNVHHTVSYSISPTSSGMTASFHEPMQVDGVRASAQTTSAPPYTNGAYGSSQPLAQPPQSTPVTQSDDMRYWNNMFRDLGFGEAVDQTYAQNVPSATASSPHQPTPPHSHHPGYGSNGRGTSNHQPYAYHHMHSNAPGYGL